MLDIYYRIRLGIGMGGFNHEIDYDMDLHLRKCMQIGIDIIISKDNYEQSVQLNDGTILEFWDTNKYYAWIQDLKIKYPNGSMLKWTCGRPTAKTMYQFKCALEKVTPPILIETNPFNL